MDHLAAEGNVHSGPQLDGPATLPPQAWFETDRAYERNLVIPDLLARAASRFPDRPALVDDTGVVYTHRGLLEATNDTVAILRALGIGRGCFVGVLAGHHAETVRGIAAVLAAGAAYVPLDPRWPVERIASALRQVDAGCLLTDRARSRQAFEVMEFVPSLQQIRLLDGGADALEDEWDPNSVVDLWDYVASSDDPLGAAGFNLERSGMVTVAPEHAYAYRDRVVSLAQQITGPSSRVLDIGCGSGIVLRALAKTVGACVGIDPSPVAVEMNRRWAADHGVPAQFYQGFAHDIEELVDGTFDLILLSSVVQFFPGPGYTDQVLTACTRLLAPGGAVLVADVVDLRARHGAGLLRLPTRFFAGIAGGCFGSVGIHRRTRDDFPPVLADRYDVVLRREPCVIAGGEPLGSGVQIGSIWDVDLPESSSPVTVAGQVLPEDPAYCIFTSGSTGEPKGVLVAHRSVVNLVDWVNREFGVDERDRLLFVTSLAFDLSVYDMFGVLAAGASLRLLDDSRLADPDVLLDCVEQEPVTFWDSAPAAMAFMLSAAAGRDRPQRTPALRRVFLSGDWVPLGMPDEIRSRFSRVEVIVLGGATEATVWSNSYRVESIDPDWPSVPYGRPMQNVRYHILDEQLAVCPIGVAGDLYIAGDCVSMGYAGDPNLTAQRFLPEPGGRTGARMYRTGDRARWMPDGNIQFLGRLDDQVKLNGYRVELGDVQSAMARHPRVGEAAAVVIHGATDHLVGFYTCRDGELDPEELRDFISTVLPSYLVPHRIIQLHTLPLSGTGKVDRHRLIELAVDIESRAVPIGRSPGTSTEDLLTRLVGELLGRCDVSVEDNFFALGGNSLLATRLLARIAAELGWRPSIAALYAHPTIDSLAAALDATSDAAPTEVIPLRDPAAPAPLSVTQQRVWFLEQLNPGNLAYNAQVSVRLTGQLDVDLLRTVLVRITERHEILRTRFYASDKGCQTEVLEVPAVDLTIADLADTGREAAEAEVQVERVIDSFVRRPFDLARPPLARWLAIRHAADDHTLVLSEHHFVHDGWSLAVLFGEIETLYTAFAKGQPDPLPPLPIQYADFAAWQQATACDTDPTEWLRRLAGAPTILDLPTDRPRPSRQSMSGRCLRLQMPVDLVHGLRDFCRSEGVTLYAVMLSVFAVLLSRYSGQGDLLVGTAAARRERPELERLIGMLVDTVAVRFDLDNAMNFRDLAHRTHHDLGELFSLPHVPIERLVDVLVPDRDPAFTPLVQAMFSFHDSPVPDLDFADLRGDVQIRHNGSAKNDINVIVVPRGEQRAARSPSAQDDYVLVLWEYCDALFDASTMQAMADHYVALLRAAISEPETTLAALSAELTPAQLQILDHLAGQVREVSPPWVVDIVLEQVRRHPDHPAVVSSAGTLSYGQLGARSAMLADRLRSVGIRPGMRVAILADRSADLVLSQLAVLRAGAVFVPIDPAYPPKRIDHILDDSGARVMLLGTGYGEWVPPPGLIPLQAEPFTDRASPSGAGSGVEEQAAIHGDDPAYVVYTSGSTGRPKGIEATHANLTNLACQAGELQFMTSQDRSALLFSTGFDGSLWEVWPALVAGATLYVPDPAVRAAPSEMVKWIAANSLTVVCMPTPLAEAVLTEPWPPDAKLRILGAGGDALRRTAQPEHPFTLLNVYGPSEATIACVVGRVEPGSAPHIGRPIGNVRAYVLDDQQRLVPPGVPGELVVGGAAVTRGYLHQPQLTAAKFLSDPFDEQPGARMYLTGDRARWCSGGVLQCLGRGDDQVKINGYRVETGEIISAIRACDGVADAYAVAIPAATGARQIVGYAVAGSGACVTPERIQAELRRALPSYMVPKKILVVPEIPTNPHGKVDRLRLPSPEPSDYRTRPLVGTEAMLAPLWAQVLGTTVTDPEADFFSLGGHSLLAIQLLAAVTRETSRAVPLATFLEAPTLSGLAEALDVDRALEVDGNAALVEPDQAS